MNIPSMVHYLDETALIADLYFAVLCYCGRDYGSYVVSWRTGKIDTVRGRRQHATLALPNGEYDI